MQESPKETQIESPIESPMSAKEAAKILRVTHNTVLGLLRKGDIPGVKIGKQWRISRKKLEEFLTKDVSGGNLKR